ncbi:MAG: hypothetical protein LBS86_07235 [Treponema sp.]|nr:hypothetical protein [Treponema sp.]
MKPIEAPTVVRQAHQPPVEAAVSTENTVMQGASTSSATVYRSAATGSKPHGDRL